MYATLLQVSEIPEAPGRIAVGYIMAALLLAVIVFLFGSRFRWLVMPAVAVYLAAVLTDIPVANNMGRVVYDFVVGLLGAFNVGEVLATGLGNFAGFVCAGAGLFAYYRMTVKGSADGPGWKRVVGFTALLFGLWFFASTQLVQDAKESVTDSMIWTWNRLPGVGSQ